MKKIILVLILVLNCEATLALMSTDEAMNFSVKTVLTSGNLAQIRTLSQFLVRNGRFDESLPQLAAELAHLELMKERPHPDMLIWMLRYMGGSKSIQFKAFVQSIEERAKSKRVRDEAIKAFKKLKNGDDVEPYVPGNFDLVAYKRELDDKRASNENSTAVSVKAVKKGKTVQGVYEGLGDPDHIEMTRRVSFRGPPVGVMEAIWDNRYRVVFHFRASFDLGGGVIDNLIEHLFRDMKVTKVIPLADLSDINNVRAQLFSEKKRDVKVIVKQLKSAYEFPTNVYDLFGEYIELNSASTDKNKLSAMMSMSIWLGSSEQGKYGPLLDNLRRHEFENLKVRATQGVFQLYVDTDQFDRLYSELDGADPATIRLAARTLYNNRVYDELTLDNLRKHVQSNLVSENRLHVDALAVMCKTIGQSGEHKYETFLKEVSELASNEKLRAHAVAAIELLYSDEA